MGGVGARPALSAPAPLDGSHDLSAFRCGEPIIDDWLRNNARAAEGRTARTYVVCRGRAVVGYHCISTGSVERGALPRKIRQGNPDPVPIAIIGRLGVSAELRGEGLGADLLGDALKRILQAADIIGIRAVVVHALNDAVATYDRNLGFQDSPIHARTMLLPLETVRNSL